MTSWTHSLPQCCLEEHYVDSALLCIGLVGLLTLLIDSSNYLPAIHLTSGSILICFFFGCVQRRHSQRKLIIRPRQGVCVANSIRYKVQESLLVISQTMHKQGELTKSSSKCVYIAKVLQCYNIHNAVFQTYVCCVFHM